VIENGIGFDWNLLDYVLDMVDKNIVQVDRELDSIYIH
jgi:hypothetical protein